MGRWWSLVGVGSAVALLLANPAAATMLFGADHAGMAPAAQAGARLDYAQFWMGAWSEKDGFSLAAPWAGHIADQGATPVVQWYYWGGDISPDCVRQGCWGSGAWKDQAHWFADATRLADGLHRGLHGRPGIVVLESEFNKRGIETWEPFDGMLAAQADVFHARAPEVQVVLGFGNWKPELWGTFDRAAAASDLVGFQTMRGATRDSSAAYLGAVDAIERAVGKLHGTFGKPVLLDDLALSSYWEPQWTQGQDAVMKDLFRRLGSLEAAGLRGVVLRSISDDPTMTTAEYYGMGERSMGLRHADGSWKPAMATWVAGVKAARGTASAAPGTSAASASDPTWQARSAGNPWWVEAAVGSAQAGAVQARVGDGAWRDLHTTSWGTWATSMFVPQGSAVQFQARLPDGTWRTSPSFPWGSVLHFTPKGQGNAWWVATRLDAAARQVEANVGGAWVPLMQQPWGDWAASLHVPAGSPVQFRAATASGTTYSPWYAW